MREYIAMDISRMIATGIFKDSYIPLCDNCTTHPESNTYQCLYQALRKMQSRNTLENIVILL